MDLATLVPLALKASIMIMVVSFALEASMADLLALARRPSLLVRSLLAMDVVMPLLALALAAAFDLHPAIRIALVALALSPVPPVLPGKQLKAGGSSSYVYGLLVTAALFSIVYIPLALGAIDAFIPASVHLPAKQVALIVGEGILVPLAIGLVIHAVIPGLATRAAKPLRIVGMVLLVVPVLALIVKVAPDMLQLVGNGTLVAVAVFVIVGLVAGHLLGGPDPHERVVLALATSSRHPGVALAIATANFPDEKLVLPAVLMFLLAGAILSIPYVKWQSSR
jgi:bile acid:Na+ symporter, BASS family